MSNGSIVLLNPVGHLENHVVTPRRSRHSGLDGARLGILTNMFRGEDLPDVIGSRLQDLYPIADVVRYEKEILSRPADVSIIDALAEQVDCVVVGVCG